MRLHTYWFIKLVFPTPLSPRMITCVLTLAYVVSNKASASHTLRRIFFLEAILTYRVVVVGTSLSVAARLRVVGLLSPYRAMRVVGCTRYSGPQ